MTPLGDAQEKCSHLPLPVSLWVFTQSLPPLVKVRHDVLAGSSFPPQVTGPVCVWPYLGCGNVGMGQFQVPSKFSNSTESSIAHPLLTLEHSRTPLPHLHSPLQPMLKTILHHLIIIKTFVHKIYEDYWIRDMTKNTKI